MSDSGSGDEIVEYLDRQIARGTMPGWMARARQQIGNPKISTYLAAIDNCPAGNKDIYWCSAFVCWVFEASQIATPRSRHAVDWLRWGVASECTPGAVAILQRGIDSYHVGLVVAAAGTDRTWLLGGQHANTVSIRAFGSDRIIGYRLPCTPVIQ